MCKLGGNILDKIQLYLYSGGEVIPLCSTPQGDRERLEYITQGALLIERIHGEKEKGGKDRDRDTEMEEKGH